MVKDYEYYGHKYWVMVEPAIHDVTKETGYIAYVNDQPPGALLYGTAVKDPEGRVQFFKTELSALTNANLVKQSELGGKNQIIR